MPSAKSCPIPNVPTELQSEVVNGIDSVLFSKEFDHAEIENILA
jgi:hypothetical protein